MDFRITIPEPCHEDWNKMAPNEQGRFCQNCSKTVVDFTKMLPEEIRSYFILNQGKGTCGHFRTEQLDTIRLTIPVNILNKRRSFRHSFLLSLLVCMGTTLFSCRDSSGRVNKIDTVTVVDSSDTDTVASKDPVTTDTVSEVDGKTRLQPRPIATSGMIIVAPVIKEHTTGDIAILPDSTAVEEE